VSRDEGKGPGWEESGRLSERGGGGLKTLLSITGKGMRGGGGDKENWRRVWGVFPPKNCKNRKKSLRVKAKSKCDHTIAKGKGRQRMLGNLEEGKHQDYAEDERKTGKGVLQA